MKKTKIHKIEKLPDFEDEYVYDIGISCDKNPWFFANNILIHNSVYFSCYEKFKRDKKFDNFNWTVDNATKLYDRINENVNASFPTFMKSAFNCPDDQQDRFGQVIKSNREIVAQSGLFLTKKRYGLMVVDKEKQRLFKDLEGKPRNYDLKIMGLEIKRSDTPKFVSVFLEKILEMVLSEQSQDKIFEAILEFRQSFRDLKPWQKGSPKKVNGLTEYNGKLHKISQALDMADIEDLQPALSPGETQAEYLQRMRDWRRSLKQKITIPGHVRAAMNWNNLRYLNGDKISAEIVDGSAVVVCALKNNTYGYSSIAYPMDEQRLPSWFTDLPFDEQDMEEKIIDKKLDNIFGVLKWDMSKTKKDTTFGDIFEF